MSRNVQQMDDMDDDDNRQEPLEMSPMGSGCWSGDGIAVVIRDESERWTPGAGLDSDEVCQTSRYWTGTVFQACSLCKIQFSRNDIYAGEGIPFDRNVPYLMAMTFKPLGMAKTCLSLLLSGQRTLITAPSWLGHLSS